MFSGCYVSLLSFNCEIEIYNSDFGIVRSPRNVFLKIALNIKSNKRKKAVVI